MTEQTETLTQALAQAGAQWMAYGPSEAEAAWIAETFGAYQAEYAAIRQRVGILHGSPRGRIEVTGEERADFLHRMISAEVRELPAGEATRGFMLNEKGRIVADMVVLQGAGRTVLELDRFDIDGLMELLDSRLFAEDVTLTPTTDQYEVLVLHGPAALTLLSEATGQAEAVLTPWTHRTVRIAGAGCLVYRRDDAGALGLHLHVPVEAAAEVYRVLLNEAGFDPTAELDAAFGETRRQGLRGRPIGWLAYNSARIESGTPIYHVDFGPDSLAHETGVIQEAVSFTKGCYLGQEVVARMESLGHPKRILAGVKLPDERMPVAGAQVFASDESGEAASTSVVGGVTSSTLSPMLGGQAIGFAVMKWGYHQPGTNIFVNCEGETVKGEISPLRFLEQ